MTESAKPQPNNPLHGITLEKILVDLRHHYGWEWLGEEVPIRCFLFDPSIQSSLKFLRRTPWARAKVEELYLRYVFETEAGQMADDAADDSTHR